MKVNVVSLNSDKKSSQEVKKVASKIKVSEFFIFILTNLVEALNLLSMFEVD